MQGRPGGVALRLAVVAAVMAGAQVKLVNLGPRLAVLHVVGVQGRLVSLGLWPAV